MPMEVSQTLQEMDNILVFNASLSRHRDSVVKVLFFVCVKVNNSTKSEKQEFLY